MKITFLGSGSHFVYAEENYHSNILIENNGKKLLYDAGTTIKDALHLNGTSVNEIDNVFVSHLHGDHSGGLEYLGFKTYFTSIPFGDKKIELISSEDILKDLWNRQLSVSMELPNKESELQDFFDKHTFKKTDKDNPPLRVNDMLVVPIKTIHSKLDSYGVYIMEYNVFITGDTKFTPTHLSKYYNNASIIFQDCEFKEYEDGYHAQFHELKTLPLEIKKKMYLYHYMLEENTYEKLLFKVRAEGFAGLVKRGFNIEL